MKRKYKKLISAALSLSILTTIVQLPAKAEPTDVHIPEIQIGEDILSNDVFYLASANAQLNEGENERYLLRLARGGDCSSKSGVTVKIADLTAKYGEDYTISLYGSDITADNPKDNQSFLEKIDGQEYTETQVQSEEEYAEMIQDDRELQAKTVEALQSTIDYLEESSGLLGTDAEFEDKVTLAEQAEIINSNPLQDARRRYTGISGEPQKVTANADTMQQIQQMANVLTNAVVGANITVEFEEGESEKYIEIDVKDNHKSDGDRYFYLMLAAPYGTTTNSAASSCALTIADDEEPVMARVGFTQSEYSASGESVTVEIRREGAINSVVSAHLTAEAGKAMMGRDFSEVDMDVIFPFGIDKRTIEIPIRTEYIIGEADFTLKLENANNCEFTDDSTVVTIEGTGGQSNDSNVELMAATDDVALRDIYVGDPINLSVHKRRGNTDNFAGDGNHYDTEGSQWYMRWSGKGLKPGNVGATWTISYANGADIAGVQLDWAKIGNASTISAAFVGSGSRNEGWAFSNGAKCFSQKGQFDYKKTNIFSTFWDPVRVSVFNDSRSYDGDRLWIHSIKPIFRPFVIQFANPDSSLEFLTGEKNNGNNEDKAVWNEANAINVEGAVNGDQNQQIVRFTREDKNSVKINVNEPNYVYLSGINIIGDDKSEKIVNWENTASTSREFKLTKTNIDKWSTNGYINFVQNNVDTDWKNPSDDSYGLRGEIKLQPVFSHIPAKVKVRKPIDDFGYFTINGESADIGGKDSQEFTYNRGDILKLSVTMRDEYKDLYKPAGYRVRAKINESDDDSAYQVDGKVNFDKNGIAYLDTGKDNRLQYSYYEITPIFERIGENSLVVRVKSSDVDKFDQDYGLFLSASSTVTVDNEEYREYIINQNPSYGQIYSVSARLRDNENSNLYITWTDPTEGIKKFCGETFYHEASNEGKYNIITLSCIQGKSSENIYQSVSGSVYRPRYNMQTNNAGADLKDPAEGAVICVGGVSTTVKEDGSFKTPPFRALSENYSGFKKLYARYVISLDGKEKMGDVCLDSGDAKEQEVSVITEKDGKNEIVHTKLLVVPQSIGNINVNTENNSIISKINVYTDKANEGTSIIIDEDTETVKAKATAGIPYTKTVIDADGKSHSTEATENVTGIEFVVYNQNTHKEILSATAEKNENDEFVAKLKSNQLQPGNELYVRITTDKSHGIYCNTGNTQFGNINEDEIKKQDEEMNQTTYSDVFTGYTFSQRTTQDIPVIQSVDLPIEMSFDELPIVGMCDVDFEFSGASIKTEKTDTGFRLSIGADAVKIADKINDTNYSDFDSDTGTDYEEMLKKKDINSLKETLNKMKDDISSAAEGKTQLGSPQWKFGVQIGVYFDFTYMSIKNPNTGKQSGSSCIFTGVGGYLGASVGFKKAWYTVIPVVFIPAYFGVEIEGNALGTFGAGTDISKGIISFDEASSSTVDFNKKLDKFEASVQVGAEVQIYVGVGLAGTLGIRGGGGFEGMVLWQPSDEYSDLGATLKFNLAATVDLILYSYSFKYEFPELSYGSFTEIKAAEESQVMLSSEEDKPKFTIRQPYSDKPSEWMPNEIQLMSAFNETSSQILVEDSYEHPDVKLIKMKNGGIFMAFLDYDLTRGIMERTVLKYSVYKDSSWSEPKVVQKDTTADFQPSICEIEDGKIMISWLSSDPNIHKTEEASDYLSKLEVYTAVINPNTGEISDETRLTNDEYYDYSPTSVYDEITGDRAVYYIKTASTGSAEDMANSYTNDCAIIYMLYSKEQGKWLFDYYYDEEVSDEEDKQILINQWNGQRFLASPIPELGLDIPNIADFAAITYNGLAVYAYTIDQDSSNNTSYDKELFVQIYDFERHMTFKPIRISNDSVSDALPQFVRTGSGESADTKLFWYRNGKNIAYIDISDLINKGINDDGTINEECLKDSNGTVQSLDSMYSYVATKIDDFEASRAMSDFKAIVDDDDIYVIWTQPLTITDEEGNKKQGREVYAAALIQDLTEEDGGSSENNDESEKGCAWSDPYRLTYTNAFTDEPNAVIDSNGNLIVMYNSYDQTLTDNSKNPVKITNFNLAASYMEPCGAVDVTEMTFSDENPNPGDTVEVNVSVRNVGLTAAKGYTVNIYEMKNGIKGNLVETITSNGNMLPGNINVHNIEWTVPEDLDGTSLYAEAQESGMTNISVFESEKFELKSVYTVDSTNIYQDADGYHINCIVTNTGNAPSTADDKLKVSLTGPYGMSYQCSKEERALAEISLDGINIDEQKWLRVI